MGESHGAQRERPVVAVVERDAAVVAHGVEQVGAEAHAERHHGLRVAHHRRLLHAHRLDHLGIQEAHVVGVGRQR